MSNNLLQGNGRKRLPNHPNMIFRHTAIMRGAVLSALGLKVHGHIMRFHYGHIIQRPFKPEDPKALSFVNPAGIVSCNQVFWWFAEMVSHSLFEFYLTSRAKRFYRTPKRNATCKECFPKQNGRADALNSPLVCGQVITKLLHNITTK